MKHLYQMTEWESNGRWHCGDVSDLSHMSNAWWYPMRILELDIRDYVLLLKNEYNVVNFHYNVDANVLLFTWQSQTDMRRFKNLINRTAKQKKFFI